MVMIDNIIHWDTGLFLYFNNLGNVFWDPFWLAVSEEETWIPLYAVLLYLLYRQYPNRKFFLIIPFIVLNVLFTDQGSVWLFKEQFQRLRPCQLEELLDKMRLVKESCGGLYGFISSHSSNTFGLAVLVGLLGKPNYRYLIVLLIVWAALVAYSRVYLGVHYPLDIMVGALYGVLCGLLVYFIASKTVLAEKE